MTFRNSFPSLDLLEDIAEDGLLAFRVLPVLEDPCDVQRDRLLVAVPERLVEDSVEVLHRSVLVFELKSKPDVLLL